MIELVFFIILSGLAPFPAEASDGLWDDAEIPAPAAKKNEDIMELPVFLKEKVSVGDDYILLGDLFGGLDEKLENKPAAPSPALGKTAELDAGWLKTLAEKHKIPWKPQNRNVKVSVTRAAQKIGREELLQALAPALREWGMPDGAVVHLNKDRGGIFLPLDTEYEIAVKEAAYDPDTHAVTGVLEIVSGGKPVETAKLRGKAVVYLKRPVARRTLTAGLIITADDILLKPVREDSLRSNETLARIEDLIGKEVKRGVKAGSPVSPDDVRTQVMVTKGKTVTLSFTKGGIMLSAQGRALENGGLGDTVHIQNPQSKSVIQGVVTGSETVTVSP